MENPDKAETRVSFLVMQGVWGPLRFPAGPVVKITIQPTYGIHGFKKKEVM
jgi:hypothetical protein